MNKLISAAGMLSLGAASLVVQTSAVASEGGTKPWSISAGLRGFYDDNIYTAPKASVRKIESFGFEISPSVEYVASFEQTTISAGYGYTGRYFEKDSHWDQSHRFTGDLKHNFSPRLTLEVGERFMVAQEPSELLGGQPLRTKGDNVSNDAHIGLTIELAPRLSAVVGYRNGLYDYSDANYKGVLNRTEHLPSLNLRYQILPSTVGVLGYQYGITDYDSNLLIPGTGIKSSDRDNTSHYAFGGVDHSFSSQLSGSVRVGAQITDYVNAPAGAAVQSKTSPYADASLKYAYAPGGAFQVGVRHQLNPTDIAVDSTGGIVQDQESTAVYASVTHDITAKLKGRITAQYQNSEFHTGGLLDGQTEDFMSAGATLSYAFTHNLSAEAAYYFDNLESKSILAREFARNRVFLGIRASY